MRYIKAPDSLITQLDIYTEEKFEDEEDLRERSLAAHRRTVSPSEAALEDLLRSAKQSDGLFPLVVDSLTRLLGIVGKDMDPQVPSCLNAIFTLMMVLSLSTELSKPMCFLS